MSAECGSEPENKKALDAFFKDYMVKRWSFCQHSMVRREQSDPKENVTVFNVVRSVGIYDTVVGKKFGIMKKYLHTTRHSM